MNKDFREAFDKTRIAGSIAAAALDEVSKIIKLVSLLEKLTKFVMNLLMTTVLILHHFLQRLSKVMLHFY